MMRRCLLGLSLGAAAWLAPAGAKADLATDIHTLSTARAAYGRVVRLKPRLLERGEPLPLAIPPELLNPKDSSCTTVSVLGVQELHFVVRYSEFDPGAPSSAFPESSAAGAAEVTRCGSGKPFLGDMLIELRSPRGVIETLVSNAPAGAPPLIEVLKNRDPGAVLALGDPGPRPALPPLAQRLQRLESRAQRDGALSFDHDDWLAREDGTGGGPLALGAGCHELTLLDETAPAAGVPPVDLDLELVDEETGAALAIDRSEDADAAVSVCVGAHTGTLLRFNGAAADARLLLTHAHWALPHGIPAGWGPDASARMAWLARTQRFRVEHEPIYESLGVQGTTELPLEVEPGACYTALLVPLRGEVQSLSLSAIAHAVGETPRGAADTAGSGLSFCAHGASHATLEVDGRGTSLAWLVATWETGRSAVGISNP